MWAFSRFQRLLGHVNYGNLKIYCGVGVSAIFLAVMRRLMIFLAVLRYSQPSNAPLQAGSVRQFANFPEGVFKFRIKYSAFLQIGITVLEYSLSLN